jgi:hypothetical protein
MSQAVSRRRVTAEARFRFRIIPCGISGGQRGTGASFSPSSSVSPVSIIPPYFPCSYITWRMNSRPVGGRSSEISSHPIDMKSNNIPLSTRRCGVVL